MAPQDKPPQGKALKDKGKTASDPAARGVARTEARLPKGFRDIEAGEIRQMQAMLSKIRGVYESYGFEPLETPVFEYTDALGKFLPDSDRPNEGVFSLQDEDDQWTSLRYDLTAPLARYVAQNFSTLPKPFRRYATGLVFRNEKPGPGRFRQFTQFDADTVGTDSVAADAEICMLAADTLEALGIKRGDYVIKYNNRKLFDGMLDVAGLDRERDAARRMIALRALDKLDRIREAGVRELLGRGRRDKSGDFTKGAELEAAQIETVISLLSPRALMQQPRPNDSASNDDAVAKRGEGGHFYIVGPEYLAAWREIFASSPIALEAISELEQMDRLIRMAGYGTTRIRIDPSVVRGLEYYTGPVLEAELTFEVKNEDGETVRFGSVGGGGRYDGLVERFTGQKVPATGFSIGVSRLQAALAHVGATKAETLGPVVVLVMDKDQLPAYQKMAQTLRQAGIRAEMYLGTSGMKAQMKYADKRGSPVVVIQGSDERAKGEVTLKDLIEGAKAAAAIKDNKEWKASRPAQVMVKEADLVAEVKRILAQHG